MKTKFLLPHSYLGIGLILLIPSLILGISVLHYEFSFDFLAVNVSEEKTDIYSFGDNNLTNELAGIMTILSLIFIGFAKRKKEDEFTFQIRLESLLWTMYVSYVIMILAFLIIHDFDFILATIYFIYLPLILYVLRFYYKIWRA